jgi:hypothetical protein
MSTTYSLKAFASRYSLTVEQLFDRTWMLYDITKLNIRHLSHPITFIHDGNPIPEFFEYRKPGVNGHMVRGSFMNQVHDLTVNERDIQAWFDAAQSTRDQRATNTYNASHLCCHGHTWFQSFWATNKSPKALLCWHIVNRNQQIEDIKNPPPVKEAEPSFFDNIKKKLFA